MSHTFVLWITVKQVQKYIDFTAAVFVKLDLFRLMDCEKITRNTVF